MPALRLRKGATAALIASLTVALTLLSAGPAAAVTVDNACVNGVQPESASSIPVTMSATALPNPVAKGGSITLSEIKQELAVPSNVFLTGYRLGLLTTGVNEVPAKLQTQIAATNTTQGIQATNVAESVAKTTITDPTPEEPASGDESATPGQVNVSYSDQSWTATGSGTIEFRELTVTPLEPTKAGITIEAIVSPVIKVKFGCDPGSVVEGAKPSTISLADPALPFASVQVEGPNGGNNGANKAPNTKLKSVKIKKHKATFKFSSNEAGSTFLCRLDKKKFAKCKSPKTYKNLKPGKHKFQVKARDKDGKVDPSPVVKKFKIKK